MLEGYTAGQLAIYRSSPERAPEEVQFYFTGARMPLQKAERIKHEVALEFGMTIKELIGRDFPKKKAPSRQKAMYRIFAETDYTLQMIGRVMGGRDHTTVIHDILRHCERHGLALPRGATWKDRRKK